MNRANLESQVLTAMRPGCYYRCDDLTGPSGLRFGQVRWAITRLARGGAVERVRVPGQRKNVWLSRQGCLPFGRTCGEERRA